MGIFDSTLRIKALRFGTEKMSAGHRPLPIGVQGPAIIVTAFAKGGHLTYRQP